MDSPEDIPDNISESEMKYYKEEILKFIENKYDRNKNSVSVEELSEEFGLEDKTIGSLTTDLVLDNYIKPTSNWEYIPLRYESNSKS